MAEYDDPENTILIELKDGTVAIKLLPDIAPAALRADERAGPRGRVRQCRFSPGD